MNRMRTKLPSSPWKQAIANEKLALANEFGYQVKPIRRPFDKTNNKKVK